MNKKDKVERNPFIENPSFHLKVIQHQTEKLYVPSSEIGKDAILKHKKETETFILPVQKGVTLYDTPYDHVFMFKEFNPTTRDLLLYIMLKIKEGEDHITLHRTKATNEMGMSLTSFYRALIQLKEYLIIVDKKKNEYWVNPFYIFKGNRTRYYEENYPDKIDITFKKYL